MKTMQRFLMSLMLLITGSCVLAQSIEEIEAQFSKGEFDKAKTTVDAFLAKEKNQSKADGWWFKGVIYNEIAKSDKFRNLVTDGRMEAFNAFKKYYELDQKAFRATLEQHVRLFDIYSGYFDMAINDFNSGVSADEAKKEGDAIKNYSDALRNFKNAQVVEEYIAGKGFEYNNFKFPDFDTTLHSNIAKSAYNAKKFDEAAAYNIKMAERRIASPDHILVYERLIEYYTGKKDIANKEKYLKLANELYPEETIWYKLELDEVNADDKKALFAKYDELCAKYPGKYELYYNYGVELFNYAYKAETKPADYSEIKKKIEVPLRKAVEIDNSRIEASYALSMHFYNVIYDLQEEQKTIKTNTPADQKKKSDLKAAITIAADEMLKAGSIAYNVFDKKGNLTGGEKASFKKVIDYISLAYELKGDKVIAEEYKKKYDSIH
jgi:hypothetical protein